MKFTPILLAVILLLAVVSDAKNRKRDKKRKDKGEEVKKDEGGIHGSFQHAKLSSHLLKRYRKMNVDGAARPVRNTTDTLKVKFGLALVDILYPDKMSTIVTLSLWERYVWNDAFLTWDPADHDGIAHVRLPVDEIYKPDIVLYNSMAPQELVYKARAVVSSDGTVLYISPTLTKLRCSRAARTLEIVSPTLTCTLRYGSWVYDGYQLDIDFYDDMKKIDLEDFASGNMYTIESNTAEKHEKFYPCCDEPYPDLTFDLVFKVK